MHISRFCPSAVILKQFLLPTSPDLTKRQEGRKTGVVFSSFPPEKRTLWGRGCWGGKSVPGCWETNYGNEAKLIVSSPFFCPLLQRGQSEVPKPLVERKEVNTHTPTFHKLFPCCCGPERKDRFSSESHTPISPSQTPKNHFQAFIAHKTWKK